MTSNMFHYEQAETEDIIARTTISGDFLQVPTHEYRTREYERESRHLINLQLHCATLTEYLKIHRIPRGLRVRLRPTVFCEKKDFCERFEQILNKCSNDLMTLTVDYLQKEISSITDKINSIETQLETTLGPEDFGRLKNRTSNTMDSYKKEAEKKKREKFVRDAEDYLQNRVYRWQDPNFFQRPHYYRGASQDSQSSSSENTGSYYQRGRPANKRRTSKRRGGGQGSADGGASTRLQVS